jgi:hypothetical protein
VYGLGRLLKNSASAQQSPSAAEAGTENKSVTSTDLKTIVSSKRNDPRMGEQTFRLTNIVRAEPDPSLFAVPSDFKIIDGGPKTIIYRRNQ